MIKKVVKMFACMLMVLGLATGCSKEYTQTTESVETLAVEQEPKMTLMIYMVGSDLEAATAAATNDMKEMEESGVDLEKVQLLVYTGGSPKWHNPDMEIPTDQHTVYELTSDGFAQVSDFEAKSMGEPDSLSRFLKYGYDNYPAENYGLILWDHGNGPVMGYGSDLLFDKDALTLPEIESALSNSPFGLELKLAFIGFDACLMASAELACMVDDYADYLIASQEVEPGFGWNYNVLNKCGSVDTLTFIQNIVEEYIAYSNAYFEKNILFKSEVTLAAVDLSYAKALEQAIDRLFGTAAEQVGEEFNQLALDRIETRAFGRATTGSEYDLVDIQALMKAMGNSYKKETKAVENVLKDMVIYSASNTVESCGLSLYYPYYNKKYYEASWKESYAQLGLFENYMEYLDNYGEIWLATDMKAYFSGRLVANEAGSGVYTLSLNEEQNARFADAGFYILKQMGEDAYSIMYYSKNVTNEEGLLKATFDGNVLYYGNDIGFKGIPIARVLDEVDGKTRYAIFPSVTGSVEDFLVSEEKLCRAVVSVDPETKEVAVLDFSEFTDEEIQTGKRPQINLEEWVRIQFYEIKSRYLTRDENNRILDYWEWPESDLIVWNEMALADGLTFSYEPIYDDGANYYLMFDVMDVQGNQYSSELFPISLTKAPEEKEVLPTEVGVLKEDSLLICHREGVKIYLDLMEDTILRQTAYCFRAENANEFPVRIYIDNIIVNETISCTDGLGYMTVAGNSTGYSTINEISGVCMLENESLAKSLSFCVRMNHSETDKTLINNEQFKLSIAPTETENRNLGTGEMVIYEADDLKMYIKAVKSVTGPRKSYIMCVENGRENEVSILMKDFVLNDTYEISENEMFFIDSMHSVNGVMDEISQSIYINNLEGITSLQFNMEISGEEPQEIRVDFDTPLMYALNYNNYLGASVNPQVLLEDSRAQVTLLEWGRNPDNNYIETVVCIENTSDETIPAMIGGIKINDITFKMSESVNFLKPGQKCYAYSYLLMSEIEKASIETITSIELMIMTDESQNTGLGNYQGGEWYSVTLSD